MGCVTKMVEENAFDPYRKWLGISAREQPPDHYRLLGLELFESDPDVIANAGDARSGHLKTFQTGEYSELSQRLLNEVAAAQVCLLNRAKKALYDGQLQQRLQADKAAEAKARVTPPPPQPPPLQPPSLQPPEDPLGLPMQSPSSQPPPLPGTTVETGTVEIGIVETGTVETGIRALSVSSYVSARRRRRRVTLALILICTLAIVFLLTLTAFLLNPDSGTSPPTDTVPKLQPADPIDESVPQPY